jgi:Methylase involved in ubiquinone/menaquinone biosynthesis
MSFDVLAPHYTWMERLLAGRRLQRARVAHLDALEGCERLLIAGVGHGHFLHAAATRFPDLEILSIDASERMLAHARAHTHSVANSSRLHFQPATFPSFQPPLASFDAIATPFFLDCFPPDELAAVIATLAAAARPCATWLVTDFSIPPRGWRRHRARAIHAAMYAFFRPVTRIRARRVTPPDPLLRSHDFHLAARRTFELGLIQSDLWIRPAPPPH